jgi:hypothetical protein
VLQRIRDSARFANVMAAIAVFVAVGGTSYAAITLPRNSVGERQLRPRSVGSDELKRGAVGSRAIKNGAIQRQDLSRSATDSLTGPPGPAGQAAISLRAAVDSSGGLPAGNATFSDAALPNKRLIGFGRSLAGCVPTATLARNGGPTPDPGPGRIVVGVELDKVVVETFNAAGNPEFLPFNLIVAC